MDGMHESMTSKDWFGLAADLEVSDPIGAKAAYLRGMEVEGKVTKLDRQLVDYPRWFPLRRRLARFVSTHLKAIRQDVNAMKWKALERPKLFVYWNSGFVDAPAVVRACRDQLLRLHDSRDIVFLDEKTWPYYVELPRYVIERVPANTAYFSDILRAALLARYGGIWVDATCFPTANLFSYYHRAEKSGFFAFRYHDARISSWFLMSGGDNYIAKMMFASQAKYWEHHKSRIHQFMIHHIFEILYFIDEGFKQSWDNTPNVSSREPHKFQQSMFKPYEAEWFKKAYAEAPIQKLTYKFKGIQPLPEMLVGHLVRGDVHVPRQNHSFFDRSVRVMTQSLKEVWVRALLAGAAGAAFVEGLSIVLFQY